jgi:hypothetical protein
VKIPVLEQAHSEAVAMTAVRLWAIRKAIVLDPYVP